MNTNLICSVGGAGGNFLHNIEPEKELFSVCYINSTDPKRPTLDGIPTILIEDVPLHYTPAECRLAAEKQEDEILAALDGKKTVFIMAGLGGGTGSGVAPYVAQLAKRQDAFVIGLVILPFRFEGARRTLAALNSIEEMKAVADAVVIASNDELFKLSPPNSKISEKFKPLDAAFLEVIHAVLPLDHERVSRILNHKEQEGVPPSETSENQLRKAISSPLFTTQLPDKKKLEEAIALARSRDNEENEPCLKPRPKPKPPTFKKSSLCVKAVQKLEAVTSPAERSAESAPQPENIKKDEPQKKSFWARLFG